jgi:hypothetical protein
MFNVPKPWYSPPLARQLIGSRGRKIFFIMFTPVNLLLRYSGQKSETCGAYKGYFHASLAELHVIEAEGPVEFAHRIWICSPGVQREFKDLVPSPDYVSNLSKFRSL